VARKDRDAIADVISRWQLAFDDHDWVALSACLDEKITVDYADLHGSAPHHVRSADYVAQRERSLSQLDLLHSHSNLLVETSGSPESAMARFNFQILRFDRHSDRHFHSWGSYRLGLTRGAEGQWRIGSIEQRVLRNDGDPNLHGSTRSSS
jgi:3-phenylpropionate/cinnamic acid dioxygenase small subunit